MEPLANNDGQPSLENKIVRLTARRLRIVHTNTLIYMLLFQYETNETYLCDNQAVLLIQ